VSDRALRWAIAIVDLDPAIGHEQAGRRRALIVSNEAFHRAGLIMVCPITTAWATPRYPGDVAIPKGHAGQTEDAVILCSQVRTISVQRIKAADVIAGGGVRYVADATIRSHVRAALSHHLGLDIPGPADGAA